MNPAIPPDDLSSLVTLLFSHKWIAAGALVIGLCVRLMKSDTKLPINIPAAYRVWIALGLGVVSGVIDKIANGTPWKDALLGGLTSAIVAIAGHEGLIESLRSGKEISVPGMMKATIPAPASPYRVPVPAPCDGSKPDDGAPKPPSAAGGATMALLFVIASAFFVPTNSGCGASFGTVVSYAQTATTDAQALLGFVKSMVDGYFAGHPNADAQTKADKGIAAAQLALDAGVRALEGVQDATTQQVNAAFSQFAAAWTDLSQLLAELGVLQFPAHPHKNAVNAPSMPVPLVISKAAGR